MTHLLFALLFLADCDDDARAALALAAQHKKAEEPLPSLPAVVTPEPPRTYASTGAEAIARGVPLVVGIGCDPVVPTGYLSCRQDNLWGETPNPPVIYVCLPKDGNLFGHVLPATSSVMDVKKKVQNFWVRPAVMQSVIPWVTPAQLMFSVRACST